MNNNFSNIGKNRIVILLCGERGAGKDTVGDYLRLAWGFGRYGFADLLRENVYLAFKRQILHGQLINRETKEKEIPSLPVIYRDETSRKLQEIFAHELSSGYWTPRALMILEGTIRRCVDPDYWARQVANKILEDDLDRVVITDWRFRNELDVLRKTFPENVIIETWRVIRPEITPSIDLSERDLDLATVDEEIINDGTIPDLYYKIGQRFASKFGLSE